MTLNLDLSSSHAKVDRAFEHLEVLEHEIPAVYGRDGPYDVRFSNVDPESGWCEVFLVPRPTQPRFGIIVGDVVHNLRSALDYIVTALADASNITLTTRHQYPIFASRTDYKASVGTVITANVNGNLSGLVYGLGLIEQSQPYHLQPDTRDDPLWHVHRFSNADKHREIATHLPIPLGTLDVRFEGTLVETKTITEISNWAPDKETMIHRMRFDPPLAQNLRVEGPIQIAITYSTPAFGSEPMHTIARQLLRKTCDHVRMVVQKFEML